MRPEFRSHQFLLHEAKPGELYQAALQISACTYISVLRISTTLRYLWRLDTKHTAQMTQLNTMTLVSVPQQSPAYVYAVVNPGTKDYADYCALRHEVFCEELGRVPSSSGECAGPQLETDDFDFQSAHVLCRSTESGLAVGCARLILPGPRGLNVLARYRLDQSGTHDVPQQVGEIGRLALCSTLRRYRNATPNQGSTSDSAWPKKPQNRGMFDGPAVAMGLYRELFQLARAFGITHCYAAMEPALARHLTRQGFPFVAAGPLNHDVQPIRRPYLVSAGELAKSGFMSRAELTVVRTLEDEALSHSGYPVSGHGAWRAHQVDPRQEALLLRA